MVTLTTSLGWLLIVLSENWSWSHPLFHASPPIVPFAIWLVTLPIFGALGFYLSLRSGGSNQVRLGVATLPSGGLMALLLFVWVFATFVEGNPFVRNYPAHMIFGLIPLVICPAVALLTGSLLLQQFLQRRAISRQA